MKAKTAMVPRMSTAATIARSQTHRLRRGPFGGVEGKLVLEIPCVGEFGLLIIVCLFFQYIYPIMRLVPTCGVIWRRRGKSRFELLSMECEVYAQSLQRSVLLYTVTRRHYGILVAAIEWLYGASWNPLRAR